MGKVCNGHVCLSSAGPEALLHALQVDINEAEPLFLKGHTARSGQEMSPVRVVKNPDGSMQRAALTQTALAKERREIKRQHERREMEAVPTEMSKPWEDPLAQTENKYVHAFFTQKPWVSAAVPHLPLFAPGGSTLMMSFRFV